MKFCMIMVYLGLFYYLDKGSSVVGVVVVAIGQYSVVIVLVDTIFIK